MEIKYFNCACVFKKKYGSLLVPNIPIEKIMVFRRCMRKSCVCKNVEILYSVISISLGNLKEKWVVLYIKCIQKQKLVRCDINALRFDRPQVFLPK